MITKTERADILKRYASAANDTGSAAVQIAFLSRRIGSIAEHLKKQKKDYATGRGLLKLIGQRRSLLGYLKRRDPAAASKILTDLGLA